MNVTWQCLAIGILFLECATSPVHETVTKNTGAACPRPNYLEFRDGARVFQLNGRFVRRDGHNSWQPVRSPQVLYWDARDSPTAQPLELAVDEAGNFTVEVGLPWSSELVCRNGQVVETEQVGQEYFLVRAEGCSNLKLGVGPKWVPHDIELKCHALRKTG